MRTCAQAQPEVAARRFLQLPGRRGRDEGAAREGDRHSGGQLEPGSGLRSHGGVEVGRAACFREQQAGESRGLRSAGEVADLLQRLRDRHRVDVHSSEPTWGSPCSASVSRC